MANEKIAEQPSKWESLSSVVALLSTCIALGGIWLYAFGQAASDSYLTELGISASTFDRQREWKILFGYSLLIKHAFLGFANLFWSLIAFLFLVSFAISANDLLRKKSSKKVSFTQWIRGILKPWIDEKSSIKQRFLFCVVFSFSTPILGIVFLLILLSLLSTPGNFGARVGKQEASEKLLALKAMNGSETAGRLSILKDGKILLEGYLLASGESFSAFYDAKTKTVHTFHMDGIELRRQLQSPKLSAVQKAPLPSGLLAPPLPPTFTHSDNLPLDLETKSATTSPTILPMSGTTLPANCRVMCDVTKGTALPSIHLEKKEPAAEDGSENSESSSPVLPPVNKPTP